MAETSTPYDSDEESGCLLVLLALMYGVPTITTPTRECSQIYEHTCRAVIVARVQDMPSVGGM